MLNAKLPELLQLYRDFRATPAMKVTIAVPGDWPIEWDYADFRRWLRRSINAKIESKAPISRCKYRKCDPDYQRDLRQDAHTINDYYGRRIRCTGCSNILRTPELQAKYPHVNTQPNEF